MFLTNFQTPRLYVESVQKEAYEQITGPLRSCPYYRFAFAMHPIEEEEPRHCFYALAYPIGVSNWVGFIKGFHLPKKGIFWIQTFGIHEDDRRQGYGTELLTALLAAFTTTSHPPTLLLISVLQENQPGVSFWEKNGFTPWSTLHKKVYHPHDTLTIYQKQLI